jgi:hypothetical protein
MAGIPAFLSISPPLRVRFSIMPVLASLLLIQSCASPAGDSEVYPSYRERAQKQAVGELAVTVSVPTAEETEAIYGVDLFEQLVQPVWVEVRNGDDRAYWLLYSGIDPNYFAPGEVAYAFSSEGDKEEYEAMALRFDELAFKNPVMPGSIVSGFVLTNLEEGFKAVDIDLISKAEVESLTFTVADPTFKSVSSTVDFDNLYSSEELILVEDESELRRLLEELPCCTTNKEGTEFGDPLNFVIVGWRNDIQSAGLRRHWHPTEIVTAESLWRTVTSFLQGSRYRYSPVSPLYVYGRRQDWAAQKARSSINERNHARFWLTPIRFQDKDVWVGQISRDIGVKYTLKSPTISTHVIDPDVDEARRYVMEDLAYSQSLAKLGYVAGVGAANKEAPRYNLVGDPYYTDGLRAVMFIEPRPHTLSDIDRLDWEWPLGDRRPAQERASDALEGAQ